jgi:hypothetical protein
MNLAAAARTVLIGLLALALLVPVLMIQGLIGERLMRRNEAVSGIAWTEVKRESVDGKLRETRKAISGYSSESMMRESPMRISAWPSLPSGPGMRITSAAPKAFL